VNSITVTNALLIAHLALAVVFVPVGRLGQTFGRRTMISVIGLTTCTAGCYFYYVLVKEGYRNPTQVIVLVTLINLCVTPVWAIVTSYITERFPTVVRATGYGIGYSVATIIPAFSSFYLLGLKALGIPYEYTQIVILALGGILLLVGALSGPETKHVDIE
jgi:MFS family permease